MPSVNKRLWLPLVCLLSAQALFTMPVNAGIESITPSDSGGTGVGDNFAPRPSTPTTSLERLTLDNLQDLQQGGSVPSANGRNLPISSQQTGTIRETLLSSTPNLDSALTQLEQQIANETGGQTFEVNRVGNTAGDVRSAVQSTNDLINQLNSQQLQAAADSPTFVALVQLLREANASLNGNPGLDFEERGGEFGLLRLSPAPLQAAEPEVVQPVEPTVEVEEEVEVTPEPPRVPAFREPIRGLW